MPPIQPEYTCVRLGYDNGVQILPSRWVVHKADMGLLCEYIEYLILLGEVIRGVPDEPNLRDASFLIMEMHHERDKVDDVDENNIFSG